MMHKHSGSSVPHDLLHFFLHIWLVTVDEAFAAGAFLLLERTLIQTHKRVILELGAFSAEFTMCSMMSFAVDMHQGFDGFLFAFYSGVLFDCHLRFRSAYSE